MAALLRCASGLAGGSLGGGGAAAATAGSPPARGLPHPQELLHKGLLEPLQDRVDHVNDALLLKLLGGWGLEARLAALPSLFLLSSPAVRVWSEQLVCGLLGGMRLGETPLEESQLEAMLHEALAAAGPEELLPPPGSLVLTLAQPPAEGKQAAAHEAPTTLTSASAAAPGATAPGAAAGGGGGRPSGATAERSRASGRDKADRSLEVLQSLERSISELDRLQLGVAPSWVVALVADSKSLRAYSQVLVFMLQLRHSATLATDASGGGGGGGGAEAQGRSLTPQKHRASYSGTGGAAAAAGAGAGGVLGAFGARTAAAPGGGDSGGGGGSSGGVGGAGGAISPSFQVSLASMIHFIAVLEQWVATQLVDAAWGQFEQDLAAARSLDDVCAAHTAYTATLLRRCFRYHEDQQNLRTGRALRKVLDMGLRFAAAVSGLSSSPPGGAVPGLAGGAAAPVAGPQLNPLMDRLHDEATKAAEDFKYWARYLVRFISARALTSPASDLGDLLLRLNYNDQYSNSYLSQEIVAQQLEQPQKLLPQQQHLAAAGALPAHAPPPRQQQHPQNPSRQVPAAGPATLAAQQWAAAQHQQQQAAARASGGLSAAAGGGGAVRHTATLGTRSSAEARLGGIGGPAAGAAAGTMGATAGGILSASGQWLSAPGPIGTGSLGSGTDGSGGGGSAGRPQPGREWALGQGSGGAGSGLVRR
ncbi:hypothetical protein GPECTOR_12g432 [Gonium pectorale]|uniref:Gamma-tubulin complex component n=1 Tax=Gonium pectorale TaxID=33097 RepID=A0A150GNR4_GONPE|nr:hypothetical protein GPECTOR_12g432 [Gonium pectorale]|eukprot:KXZ51469.1 hypothetical protein GPECTOR_12g432 [Gonium pectorale]